ncbi:hypothetical protein [Neptuniibacter sp. QD34_54]
MNTYRLYTSGINTRHAIACGLTADLAGIIAAITVGYWFFG